MRSSVTFIAIGAIVTAMVSGCVGAATDRAGGDPSLTVMMLSDAEAEAWLLSPDDGPVDGETPDCTGAPYDWPDLTTVAFASQFLDRRDETVGLILKRFDGAAEVMIEALRGALEPCAPASGAILHGAMIDPVGDDSFAYQSTGQGDQGEFSFSNMLVACGDLLAEASAISYSDELDQSELEELLEPVLSRMFSDQGCSA